MERKPTGARCAIFTIQTSHTSPARHFGCNYEIFVLKHVHLRLLSVCFNIYPLYVLSDESCYNRYQFDSDLQCVTLAVQVIYSV
ncbi:hypothetical protein K1T71_012126 [Dendrolimus kikuchii]|uniref:Uncharacterized protein n=1 Tax=Dendrolimus kikuchii TaxID=765133 RepID=A0ACC1CKT7_9NEOP|nr:hypothetical protein K1T71_012126 [Dendrolimus kikuchii]